MKDPLWIWLVNPWHYNRCYRTLTYLKISQESGSYHLVSKDTYLKISQESGSYHLVSKDTDPYKDKYSEKLVDFFTWLIL